MVMVDPKSASQEDITQLGRLGFAPNLNEGFSTLTASGVHDE